MPAALEHFSSPVREWFERAFGEPTPPQVEGRPPIARGETTLISAPTGSGKTLVQVDRCGAWPSSASTANR